jgi:hypothetical protein
MGSGDPPGLQNRRAAGHPVAGAFDSHTLPPVRFQSRKLHMVRGKRMRSGAVEKVREICGLPLSTPALELPRLTAALNDGETGASIPRRVVQR